MLYCHDRYLVLKNLTDKRWNTFREIIVYLYSNHDYLCSVPLQAKFVIVVILSRTTFATVQQSSEDQYVFPKLGAYKYVAHISSKAGLCTGSIINEDWILTAAHCFWFRKKVINPGDARILAGVTNYEQPNAHSKQDTMSEEIHVHPNFVHNKLAKYDVALVKVRDKMTFGEFVDKISVSASPWPTEDPKTLDCISLGFGGYFSTAPATADLKVWNVTMAGHEEESCPCTRRFQSKRLICVKEAIGRMCQSDNGGPLVCDNEVRAISHMVGDRATCDDPVYPRHKCVGDPEKVLATYMFLCPVNSWLNSIVPDIPPTPESCKAPRAPKSMAVYALLILTLPIKIF